MRNWNIFGRFNSLETFVYCQNAFRYSLSWICQSASKYTFLFRNDLKSRGKFLWFVLWYIYDASGQRNLNLRSIPDVCYCWASSCFDCVHLGSLMLTLTLFMYRFVHVIWSNKQGPVSKTFSVVIIVLKWGQEKKLYLNIIQ